MSRDTEICPGFVEIHGKLDARRPGAGFNLPRIIFVEDADRILECLGRTVGGLPLFLFRVVAHARDKADQGERYQQNDHYVRPMCERRNEASC